MTIFLLEQKHHNFLFSYGFSAGKIEDYVILEKEIRKKNSSWSSWFVINFMIINL